MTAALNWAATRRTKALGISPGRAGGAWSFTCGRACCGGWPRAPYGWKFSRPREAATGLSIPSGAGSTPAGDSKPDT